MKQKSKIILIPPATTIVQMQTALDNAMDGGWELRFIFVLGVNTYAVFIKTIAQ